VLILGVKASLVKVFGRVQRVGYRRHVLDSAQELGLSGYVRNEKDGSVTVFVQGDDAAVEKFIEMLKTPPQPAHVKSLEVKEAGPRPALKYFTIKPSQLHEELQEGFGAMQSIFIDYWGGVKASLVKVFGRVQRVGYRRHVLDSAQELGLSGYVETRKTAPSPSLYRETTQPSRSSSRS
jgi:acylphosphatase